MRKLKTRRSGLNWQNRFGFEALEARRLMAVLVVNQFGAEKAQSIVTGPDGNLWSADYFTTMGLSPSVFSSIGESNPTTGASQEFSLSTNAKALGIAVGPDGNLWFTENGTNNIGEINPTTHVITEFPIPTLNSQPQGITAGADGNLWFTENGAGKIASINPTTKVITEYPLTTSTSAPSGIVSGPDGNLWFTETNTSEVASFNPMTKALAEFATPTANSGPAAIAVGPDQNLWFIESMKDQLGTIDPSTHVITEYPAGTSSAGMFDQTFSTGPDATSQITSGPYGDLYFTNTGTVPNSQGDTEFVGGIGDFNLTTHVVTSTPIDSAEPTSLFAIIPGPNNTLFSGDVSGLYTLQVIAPGQTVIRSNVYADPNANGTFSGGPLANRTVYLDLKGDGTLDPGDPTSITDSTGYYQFVGIAAGTYTVRVVTYPGDIPSGLAGVSQVVVAGGGQLVNPYTFGITQTGAVQPLTLNATPFGSNNPDVSTAEVNGLYQIILGRAADPTGQAAAVTALKHGTPLTTIASNLLNSPEYFTDLAISDYQNYLGRTPSSIEINNVVSALEGGLSAQGLAGDLMSSQEFSNDHPTNAEFITAAYEDTLGRPANATEIANVSALITGGLSRPLVIGSLLGSNEAYTRSINGFYTFFLLTAGDAPGVASWLKLLKSGTPLFAVAAGIASSPAFVARANTTVS